MCPQLQISILLVHNKTHESVRAGTWGLSLKIYLDVSCLNRPFDDQSQLRIRLEAEAVSLILANIENRQWVMVSSEIVDAEVNAIRAADRKKEVQTLLKLAQEYVMITEGLGDRADELAKKSFKPADALHVAAAEAAQVAVMLSCDDRLCRTARRRVAMLHVRVMNPVEWLKELNHHAHP